MKKCSRCKQEKDFIHFPKNKSKKDGYSSECKLCISNSYLKELICTNCNNKFYIKHRNVRTRKLFLCEPCLKQRSIERIIKQNKEKAIGATFSSKGYLYTKDILEKHGYKLKHRKVMEESIKRNLTKKEIVHHIDGDRTHNLIENLFLTDNSGHRKAHRSLDQISYMLVKNGLILFNKETGQYLLCPELKNFLQNIKIMSI